MFVYITDIFKTTWAINANKIIKFVENQKITLIYLDDGVIIKTTRPMAELVAQLNLVQ
jgi:DNA invertase Pin-like site-specific DNA recombinase